MATSSPTTTSLSAGLYRLIEGLARDVARRQALRCHGKPIVHTLGARGY
jgi:hypothetical protein